MTGRGGPWPYVPIGAVAAVAPVLASRIGPQPPAGGAPATQRTSLLPSNPPDPRTHADAYHRPDTGVAQPPQYTTTMPAKLPADAKPSIASRNSLLPHPNAPGAHNPQIPIHHNGALTRDPPSAPPAPSVPSWSRPSQGPPLQPGSPNVPLLAPSLPVPPSQPPIPRSPTPRGSLLPPGRTSLLPSSPPAEHVLPPPTSAIGAPVHPSTTGPSQPTAATDRRSEPPRSDPLPTPVSPPTAATPHGANPSVSSSSSSSSSLANTAAVTRLEQEVRHLRTQLSQCHVRLNECDPGRSQSMGGVRAGDKRKSDGSPSSPPRAGRPAPTSPPPPRATSPLTAIFSSISGQPNDVGPALARALGQAEPDALYALFCATASIPCPGQDLLSLGRFLFRAYSALAAGECGPQPLLSTLTAVVAHTLEGSSACPADIPLAALRVIRFLLQRLSAAALPCSDGDEEEEEAAAGGDAIIFTNPGLPPPRAGFANPRIRWPSAAAPSALPGPPTGSQPRFAASLAHQLHHDFLLTDDLLHRQSSATGSLGDFHARLVADCATQQAWAAGRTDTGAPGSSLRRGAEMHAVDAYLRRHSGDRSLPVLLETLLRYVKHVVATKQAAAYADLLSAAFDIFDVVLGAPGATATMRHRLAYQLISDRTIECLLVWDSQSGPSVPLLVIQAVLKVVPSVFAHLGERLTGLLHAFSESTVDTLLDRLIALLRLATPAVVVADAEGATTAVLAASTLNQLVLQVPRFPIYLLRLELPGATLPANAPVTPKRAERPCVPRPGPAATAATDDVSQSDAEAKSGRSVDKMHVDEEDSEEESRQRLRAKLLLTVVMFVRQMLTAARDLEAIAALDGPLTLLECRVLRRMYSAAKGEDREASATEAGQSEGDADDDAEGSWADWDAELCPEVGSQASSPAAGAAALSLHRRRYGRVRDGALQGLRLLHTLALHVDLAKVDMLRSDIFWIMAQMRSRLEAWQPVGQELGLDPRPAVEFLESLDFNSYET